jgi:hypothetical protein
MFGYLFYSSRCESSANFIRIITSEKINPMFNLISIDTMSTEQLISLGIKKTPMLVLRNQNNETTAVHEGPAAFEWLNNLIQFRRQNMMMMVEQNRKKLIQSNMAQQLNKDNVTGRSDELSGMSDNFTYINVDYVSTKSYLPYGQDNDFKILTFKDNQGKITERDMKSRISEYETSRNKTDSDIKNIVDNQLKSSLLNQLNQNPNSN